MQIGTFSNRLVDLGYRLKGRDCLHAGISTHAVRLEKLDSLQSDLVGLGASAADDTVRSVLDRHQAGSSFDADKEFSLGPHAERIDRCFGAASVEEIVAGLEADGSEWAARQASTILRCSPSSLKVAFRQMREGGKKDSLAECLVMEYRIARQILKDHDFYEGVRALLVDKDNSPKWNPSTLEGVTDEIVEKHFRPLPGGEDLAL